MAAEVRGHYGAVPDQAAGRFRMGQRGGSGSGHWLLRDNSESFSNGNLKIPQFFHCFILSLFHFFLPAPRSRLHGGEKYGRIGYLISREGCV